MNNKSSKTNSNFRLGKFEIVSILFFLISLLTFYILIIKINNFKEIGYIKNNIENTRINILKHINQYTINRSGNNDNIKSIIKDIQLLKNNTKISEVNFNNDFSPNYIFEEIINDLTIDIDKTNINDRAQNLYFKIDIDQKLLTIIKELDLIREQQIHNLKVILFLILMIISLLVFFINSLRYNSVKSLKNINLQLDQLLNGEFLNVLKNNSVGVIKKIEDKLFILSDNIKSITDFTSEIGKENFDAKIEAFNNQGQLIKSLLIARDSIKDAKIREDNHQKSEVGIEKINHILINYVDKKSLCNNFLSTVCQLTNGLNGCLYMLQDANNDQEMYLCSTYAFDNQNIINQNISISEGPVGQCVKNKSVIYLLDIPADFYQINSSLGRIIPKTVLFFPIKFNDVVLGVLEIAYINEIEKYNIDFLAKVAESLAAVLKNIIANENADLLLKMANIQKEQLQSQEEELRQNMEEVISTQEDLVKKENEKSVALTELRSQHSSLLNDYEYFNKIIDIAGRNRMLSQKISFNIELVFKDPSRSKIPLREAFQLHDKSFNVIKNGGTIDYNGEELSIIKFEDLSVLDAIEEVGNIWNPFKNCVLNFLDQIDDKVKIDGLNENLIFIESNSELLLLLNNKLVQKIVSYSKLKNI